ncbi:hypothetical protein [Rhodoferax koreensis]|uniref:hypothetical protein n=1 Tax=Rhodoferax koreensis TaxID=1842727 RepID=UPI0012FF9E5F|nr:hypothetical protein [Rhodoferax koreense]
MRTTRILSALLVTLGSAVFVGCGKSGSVPVVSIQSVTPAEDAALVGGEQVTFSVTVRAQGISVPSTVALVVQSKGQLLGATDAVPIEEGIPKTLTIQTLIPATTSVQILTPLYLGDGDQTSVVDVRHFKVVGIKAVGG